MHRMRAVDFWRFRKNLLVDLRPASGEDGWLSLARGDLGQVSHDIGRWRWKSQYRKIVRLSPYVEQPLNSRVIKSFVPELRSRKCFSCFEIPMFYLYGHSMYVSHIAISWLWYISFEWHHNILFLQVCIQFIEPLIILTWMSILLLLKSSSYHYSFQLTLLIKYSVCLCLHFQSMNILSHPHSNIFTQQYFTNKKNINWI